MPTIWAGVRLAGACEAVLFETAMTRVSTANGNACRPAWVSAALLADEERAKSMSVLLAAPYSRPLPAPEPFGRLMAPLGRVIWPPPVAANVAILAMPWVRGSAFHASANSLTACWVVSEPTPIRSEATGVNVVSSGSVAALALPADRATAEPARATATAPARVLRTNISVRSLSLVLQRVVHTGGAVRSGWAGDA